MYNIIKLIYFICMVLTSILYCSFSSAAFDVVALGVRGGMVSDNLTSFLIKSDSQHKYLALDAGTTLSGIDRALSHHSFPELKDINTGELSGSGYVFQKLTDSYWISHGHLDHVAGLVISSPDDIKKTVYGTSATLNYISNHLFNWVIWPNLTDKGRKPHPGRYHLNPVKMYTSFNIGDTGLTGVAFPLDHGGYLSSMLLISDGNKRVAFYGDTGADSVQKSVEMKNTFIALAKYIKDKSLSALIIETSYSNETPDKALFGHLTPRLLLEELHNFEKISGGKGSLRGLKILIIHMKPDLNKATQPVEKIKVQLMQGNDLGVHFIFPEQGERLTI